MKIRQLLYNNFGAMSKKYFDVLFVMQKQRTFTLSEITKKCNVSFKMVTNLVNLFKDYFSVFNKIYKIDNSLINDINKESFPTYNKQELINKYHSIVSNFKEDKSKLDHISATAETAIKRALFIADNYDIEFCNIGLVGDHDFTSIALNLINCNNHLYVFDIDNDILNFIDLSLKNVVTTVYSDFRIGIPKHYNNTFDVVFTDPPYTTEGMETFLAAAKSICKHNENSSILCAYACGDIVIKNGYNVQEAIIKQGLYIEQLLHKFNIYNYAESLGYCSDLYVLRLTNIAYNGKNVPIWNIYTHGELSLESANTSTEKTLSTMCKILTETNNQTKSTLLDKPLEIDNKYVINLPQFLINMNQTEIKITNIKNFNKASISLFFDVLVKEKDCIFKPNNNIYGLFVVHSHIKLENFLIKKVSLILNKTKNQLRELIENNEFINKYKELYIGAIPYYNLIKIIDFLSL